MTSDLGYYRMHRGWQDHPVFRNEPYSERGAWEWLIAHAAYQPTTISVAGSPVDLERGQLSYSVRFLADRWRWSKSKVARYLDRLQKWEMILYGTCSKSGTASGTASGTGQSVITVCNYERYQLTPDESGTASGTKVGQKRDRSGTNKNKVKEITTYMSNRLWEVWIEELGGEPPHPQLDVGKRREVLESLYEEQLKPRSDQDDPVDLFRRICRTVKQSEHHMSMRAYQMPDSLFRNEARRERWTLDALSVSANGNGNGKGPNIWDEPVIREKI